MDDLGGGRTSMARSSWRAAGPVLLMALALAGCGHQGSSDAGAAGATSTQTPTPTPTPTPSPDRAVIPDDFPLAQGLVADSDTTVGTPRHGGKGIVLERTCWGSTWPGDPVDRLVVQQVGPELGVTRELAVYGDAATAAAVVEQVRLHAERCHRLPATSGQDALDVTPQGGAHAGTAHVAVRFAETLTGGQPGGSVFVFTRVGRAVLAVEDSGEWTRDSATEGARHLERADRALAARLCAFSRPGC